MAEQNKRQRTEAPEETAAPPSAAAAAAAAAAVATPAPAGGAAAAPSLGKRGDYLTWDDYFMSVAFLSAMRSKDPSTQVGAAIVNSENRIVGIGYNGFPTGCSDDKLPWTRKAADELDTKYMYVVHAEMNAILNKNAASIKGSRIYVALFPCNECAKLIIQSGICEVIYVSDKYHDSPKFVASRRMFGLAGVTCRQYRPAKATVTIDFSLIDGVSAVAAQKQPFDDLLPSSTSSSSSSSTAEVSPDGDAKKEALATPGSGWATNGPARVSAGGIGAANSDPTCC